MTNALAVTLPEVDATATYNAIHFSTGLADLITKVEATGAEVIDVRYLCSRSGIKNQVSIDLGSAVWLVNNFGNDARQFAVVQKYGADLNRTQLTKNPGECFYCYGDHTPTAAR